MPLNTVLVSTRWKGDHSQELDTTSGVRTYRDCDKNLILHRTKNCMKESSRQNKYLCVEHAQITRFHLSNLRLSATNVLLFHLCLHMLVPIKVFYIPTFATNEIPLVLIPTVRTPHLWWQKYMSFHICPWFLRVSSPVLIKQKNLTVTKCGVFTIVKCIVGGSF